MLLECLPEREKRMFVNFNVTHLQKVRDKTLTGGGPNKTITYHHDPISRIGVRHYQKYQTSLSKAKMDCSGVRLT
jgi:hypothetical protein